MWAAERSISRPAAEQAAGFLFDYGRPIAVDDPVM
jgi:hypothetical protein